MWTAEAPGPATLRKHSRGNVFDRAKASLGGDDRVQPQDGPAERATSSQEGERQLMHAKVGQAANNAGDEQRADKDDRRSQRQQGSAVGGVLFWGVVERYAHFGPSVWLMMAGPCSVCGTSFRYLNPLRCRHCGAPYLDFIRFPEMRPHEYYGCTVVGEELH